MKMNFKLFVVSSMLTMLTILVSCIFLWRLHQGSILKFDFISSVIILVAFVSIVITSIVFRSMRKEYAARVSAEEECVRITREWEATFDSITDLVFMQDKDFIITRVNKAFAAVMKLDAKDIIGKKCYELLHHMQEPWATCPFEKTRLDHKPHTEEVDDPNIGIPLLVTTSPIFDEKGNFLGSVHIAKDISERKNTEERLKREIDSLERYQKLTVDRELKMKELKEEIAELKKKLGEK